MKSRLTAALLQTLCRRFPLLTGRATLVQYPPLSWVRLSDQPQPVVLPDGRSLVVFPNDLIGKAVYFFGDLDPKIPQTLNRLLDPGDTLVDVGANIGLVCLVCLPRLGPAGRAVAVEPQPDCCAVLAQTIALNQLHNLEVHPLALSNQAGNFTLHLPDPGNRGTASLEPTSSARKYQVVTQNSSKFLETLRLSGEYAVKIDVEGHEGQVLAGMISYIERHPPRGIVFESHAHLYRGEDFCSGLAWRLLTGAGFRIFQIPKAFLSLKYREICPEGPPPRATDFVAVRPDAIGRLLGNRKVSRDDS